MGALRDIWNELWNIINHLYSLSIFSTLNHKSRHFIIKTIRLNKSNKFALRKGFNHAYTDNI